MHERSFWALHRTLEIRGGWTDEPLEAVLSPWEFNANDVNQRITALEAVLNADLDDHGALGDLADFLYHECHLGRGGRETAPTEDDLPILREALYWLRYHALGYKLPVHILSLLGDLLMLGNFCHVPLVAGTGGGVPYEGQVRRERVWMDGDVDDEPFPTARKIAADLMMTIEAIHLSKRYRLCRCAEEDCNRLFVAGDARAKYCSHKCRARSWARGRKGQRIAS